MIEQTYSLLKPLLCSECFYDQGLALEAKKIGNPQEGICANCKKNAGLKLDEELISELSYLFFVRGSVLKCDFGAAPIVQFNNKMDTDIEVSSWLENDLKLIEEKINVGFFHYGPRLWMVGEVEPLKSLQKDNESDEIINRIIDEYPDREITKNDAFYRIRLEPKCPCEKKEYDSPPDSFLGTGRLDLHNLPILYGSQDLEVCLHECRATVEDEIYVATLIPTNNLKLLDLTEVLEEDDTEFESLDMAVHMLFFAKSHSYQISRKISEKVFTAGYDGIIYPSYFSSLRTGATHFDTVYGLSVRKFPNYKDEAKSQIIENIALFGRPVQENKVEVKCINKLIIGKVDYDIHFGPLID